MSAPAGTTNRATQPPPIGSASQRADEPERHTHDDGGHEPQQVALERSPRLQARPLAHAVMNGQRPDADERPRGQGRQRATDQPPGENGQARPDGARVEEQAERHPASQQDVRPPAELRGSRDVGTGARTRRSRSRPERCGATGGQGGASVESNSLRRGRVGGQSQRSVKIVRRALTGGACAYSGTKEGRGGLSRRSIRGLA
jgi:hypothetical protein